MKILLVSGSFPPMHCGVGDYTSMLAAALGRRKDAEVAVLTHVLARLPDSEVPYVLLSVADGWRVSETLRIVRTIREWTPDVIHFQFPGQGYGHLQWMLPSIFRMLYIPVFVTLHEYFPVSGFESLLSALLNLPNLCVANGVAVTRGNYHDLVPSIYSRVLRRKAVRHITIASNIPTVTIDEQERERMRNLYGNPPGALLSYFGFASPQKGVEDIFRIADPDRQSIALICVLEENNPYHQLILDIIETPPWRGRVRTTGFLPAREVGKIMAASDAIVLPFRKGASIGNGTLHGAVAQGTFTLTTSRERSGYDQGMNVYFAQPGNIEEMSSALDRYSGTRIPREEGFTRQSWDGIAAEHLSFYQSTAGATI
jgi:glycosyltransferase involved in cell wall biosynthesis